jgi:hypothetical protein
MSEQQQTTFFSRLGSWFRKGDSIAPNGDGGSETVSSNGGQGGGQGNRASTGGEELPLLSSVQRSSRPPQNIEPRGWFVRPGAKRDAAITRLQDGFGTLTDLMSSVRDSLEKQGRRQDELLTYLSHLPAALESLPESNRIHGETLKAIHQQLGQQNGQQEKLAEILEKLSESGGESKEILTELTDRVDTLRQTDQAIADNLNSVGSAMATVSKHSVASAQVLEQMRDNINSRDGQLERVLARQSHRFTVMLSVAIFLSIAALGAVAVVGYLLLNKPH